MAGSALWGRSRLLRLHAPDYAAGVGEPDKVFVQQLIGELSCLVGVIADEAKVFVAVDEDFLSQLFFSRIGRAVYNFLSGKLCATPFGVGQPVFCLLHLHLFFLDLTP